MDRWLVNPDKHTVRKGWQGPRSQRETHEIPPDAGEVVFFAPTARDAAEMGARHALAEEALDAYALSDGRRASMTFLILGDAIEANTSDLALARESIEDFARMIGGTYDVWIEAGCRALVLGRVPR